ncbi:MAG TPA: PmoA family protein [Sumerlaeia bacterium]|nr:PmoA family protein [Sumerlaeia bacterium]
MFHQGLKDSRSAWVSSVLAFALFPAFSTSCASGPRAIATIQVDAGEHARIDTPMSLALAEIGHDLTKGGFRLEEVKGAGRTPAPAQISAGDSPRLCWILSGATPAGRTRTFELVEGDSTPAPEIRIVKDDKALEIRQGDAKVLQYNYAPVPPPDGVDPIYTRSGFIHPLWSPAGAVLTRIHPPDHYHHLGIWNPWTLTKFEGRNVDFWNLKSGQGTVRFVRFASEESGPVFGGFQAIHEHVNLNAPGGEKAALIEEQGVRVWNTRGAREAAWLWDFTSTQRCASSNPLHLLKYRYGGFGFRGTADWKEGNSDYLTSEGKTRKDGHGTRARWCMVYGETSKGPAGVLFMSHPGNRSHPEPMRIWPEGDVFFNFCPIQQEDWTLEPGNDYALRYRMVVYDGEISTETAERFWTDFGDPPKVEVAGRD